MLSQSLLDSRTCTYVSHGLSMPVICGTKRKNIALIDCFVYTPYRGSSLTNIASGFIAIEGSMETFISNCLRPCFVFDDIYGKCT